MTSLAVPPPGVPDTSSCSICHKPAIYTCPGCTSRTCSASCSSAHKTQTACTGTRNRAAYVPMNNYSLGSLMNDYTFLEDVGRKVGQWGQEIVRERLVDVGATNTRGRGGRGRGGMRGRGSMIPYRGGKAATKREALKRQLDLWDIEVELLPSGMAKAQQNRSAWDFKNKKFSLTVEFMFHAPPPPLPTQAGEPPWSLLTHQNGLEEPLLSLIQRHTRSRGSKKGDQAPAEWVTSMVLPTPEDPEGFASPELFLVAPSLSGRPGPSARSFYALNGSQAMSAALRNTSFVEYPTIHIYGAGDFKGTIVNRQGTITRVIEEERPAKRRRTDKKKSAVMMKGLVGDYGSEEEGSEEEDGALAGLGDYPGSDDEDGDPDFDSPGDGIHTKHSHDEDAALDAEADDGDANSPEEYDDEEADRQLIADLERRIQEKTE